MLQQQPAAVRQGRLKSRGSTDVRVLSNRRCGFARVRACVRAWGTVHSPVRRPRYCMYVCCMGTTTTSAAEVAAVGSNFPGLSGLSRQTLCPVAVRPRFYCHPGRSNISQSLARRARTVVATVVARARDTCTTAINKSWQRAWNLDDEWSPLLAPSCEQR